MLDDERNDIYIHMDKKNTNYNSEELQKEVTKSGFYSIDRISVMWGGYSQIDTVLNLLQSAAKNGSYQYYHLLSGADLPIQTQDDIHSFFDKYSGKEFVGFNDVRKKDLYQVNLYHIFQEHLGRGNKFSLCCNSFFLNAQKIFHINRNRRNNIDFRKGANWFSITDSLARYVIQQEEWIRQIFKYTRCCDEIFLQTVIANSSFIDSVYDVSNINDNVAALRLIDWKRGTPYTYCAKDYKELIDSPMMFARKFDCNLDCEIVKKIGKYYGKH